VLRQTHSRTGHTPLEDGDGRDALVPGALFSQAGIRDGLLWYIHDGSEAHGDSIRFFVSDGADTTTTLTFPFQVTAVNDAPTLIVADTVDVDESAQHDLLAEFSATDPDTPDSDLLYTVIATPAWGELRRDATALAQGQGFSEAELRQGRIAYAHGGERWSRHDGLSLSLDDGVAPPRDFDLPIRIALLNDLPYLLHNTGATVAEQDSVLIDAAALAIADSNQGADQLLFLLQQPLRHGQLRDGTAVIGTVFSQQQLDGNGLYYHHDGSESFGDSLLLRFTDGIDTMAVMRFAIGINAVNDSPQLVALDTLFVSEGGLRTLGSQNLECSDPDNSSSELVYTIQQAVGHGSLSRNDLPLGSGDTFSQADINAARVLYRHDNSEHLEDLLRLSLSDGELGFDNLELAIRATGINDPPVFLQTLPDTTIAERDSLAFTFVAQDNETAVLEYTLLQPVENSSLGLHDGHFRFVPDWFQAGEVTFGVRVMDGDAAWQDTQFRVTVSNTNRAPVFTSLPADTTVEAGDTLRITLHAADADLETLAFRILEAPAGLTLDAATGQVSYHPGYDAAGWSQSVTVGVSDGNLSDSTRFVVNPFVRTPARWNKVAPVPGLAEHLLELPADAVLRLGRDAFRNGHLVGAFAVDSLGNPVYGGHGTWLSGEPLPIRLQGDNPDTPVKDGFAAGDSLFLRIWNPRTQSESVELTATPQAGPLHFEDGASTRIGWLAALEERAAQVPLDGGWSLVSTNLRLHETRMDSLLQDLGSNLVVLSDIAGHYVWPAQGANQIQHWDPLQAYQIKVNQADLLDLAGLEIVPEALPVAVPAGWNLIAYPRITDLVVAGTLEGIFPTMVLAQAGDGTQYWPAEDVNTLGVLLPGEGYKLFLAAADTIVWPADVMSQDGLAVARTGGEHAAGKSTAGKGVSHKGVVNKGGASGLRNSDSGTGFYTVEHTRTGASALLLLKGLADHEGAGLALKTPDGRVVAAARVENGQAALCVWGDDFTTPALVDGARVGEELTAWLHNRANGAEQELRITGLVDALGGHTLGDNRLIYANNRVWKAEGIADSGLPARFALYPNHPNPFNPETTIRFDLPEDAVVQLAVYNVLGQRVATLAGGALPAGRHSVHFRADALASGLYICRLESAGFVQTRKMMLLK
jgi:hypothetical protein